MAISKPTLPPKAGYVEKIDENGNRIYVPTPETAAKLYKDRETSDIVISKLKLQPLLDVILGGE